MNRLRAVARAVQAFVEWLNPRAKAIAGGLTSLQVALTSKMVDGLTATEVVEVVMLALTTALVVYAVPNTADGASV